MTWTTMMIEGVRESAFLRDLTPADRRIGRILLTLPVGAVAGALAAVVGGVATLSLYGALVVGLEGQAAARGLLDVLSHPALLTASLSAALLVLTLLAGTNGPMAVAFTAMAALLNGRQLVSYVTSARRFRWRLLVAGLGLFVLGVGPLLALDAWLDPATKGIPLLTLTASIQGRLAYAGATIGLLLIAAAAEELVFRGWLLKVTAAFTRNPWALLIVNSLVFATIHFDPNLDAFVVRTVMGAGLTYMTLRLGGLEFAIGAHAANNIVILLFLQPMSLLPQPPHPFRPEVLLVAAAMLAAYVALSELVVRWPPLRRWTGVEAP